MDNISLRDWFAGQALIAIADDCGMTDEEVAERCYQRADALLAESKKRETFEPEYDDEGWIRHKGDGMPVALDAIIQLEGGSCVPASSVNWNWAFRYRIATKAGVTK